MQSLLTSASRAVAAHFRSKPFTMQNRVPLVSFTFDGCPDTACTNGASILSDHGVLGTFYISAGLCDSKSTYWHVVTPEQVRALHDQGHEIGCQTFSNANVETLNAARLDEECRMNHNLLRRLCGDIQVTNFSYPDGKVSLARKIQLQHRFDTCRSTVEGINVGTIDLALLKVVELYDRTLTPEKLQGVLRETCDRNGWLIFYTHDVADPVSWVGCTPARLRSTIETVQSMGIACVPIREALRHIGYPIK